MTNGEYTPRFVEDYAIKALKANPELTDEQIAQQFIKDHGNKYDAYLRSLGAYVKSTFNDEISSLEEMKDKLKEDFIRALQERDILTKDETDKKFQIVKDYIKNIKLNFTLIGGGYGGTATENYVNIDWIQTYKFITDYPESELSFYNIAIITVFHEFAHRLSYFLGNPTKYVKNNKYLDEEESFAQGVAKIIANNFGIRDDYTTYYMKKEKEVQGLDRSRMTGIIGQIYSLTYRQKINPVLNQRCYNLMGIYGPNPQNPRRIELYAHPTEEYEIKAMEKI